ncbi:MAG: uracil-DNA glycosylase family protein [Alphaproteobacteria bacterium]|nr:uracil-DNA glycosylase family protein [Alphaproteobacteria bacterium]
MLERLLSDIRACRICADHLPLGPRPVVVARGAARILIIGQAPGTKVHATGIPWNDRSGDTLRGWMAVDRDTFYDPDRIAILPMGFCYPGVMPSKNGKSGGDAPPRPECAPEWHEKVLAHLPQIELILLAGMYAQARYLGDRRKKTLTETVASWREYGPKLLPLPHPSWRSGNLIRKNPWFEAELLPVLRARVEALI